MPELKNKRKGVTLSPENLTYINSHVDIEDADRKDFSKTLNYLLNQSRAILNEYTKIKSNEDIISITPKLSKN